MSKGSSKTTVGFQYKFGMHAVLGLYPIARVVRIRTDNQDLVTEPQGNGEVVIAAPTIYSASDVSDGVSGKIKFHLNGTPEFDSYLLANYGIDPTLVPRFDAVAHVVFTGTRTVQGSDETDINSYWEELGLAPPTVTDAIDAGAGPFYFGNSAFPRSFDFFAERSGTACPYDAYALIEYTHEEWDITLSDFNPLVMYWEFFIKHDPDSYGTTWAGAAATVHGEGIGIYFYGGGGDLEALEREICRYVNGRTYIDRTTGLKEIELIRGGYDVADLITISESDLIGDPDIVDPDRSLFNNTIDVTFTDRTKNFDTGALTVQDGAHVAAYGVQRQEGDYTWATNRELANFLGLRDLSGMTGAGISGKCRVSGLHPDLHNGSLVIMDFPSFDVSTVVCRIVSIAERGLRDNSVDVTFIADTFGVEVAPVVVNDLPGTESTIPIPAEHQLAFEVPYYLGLLIGGDDFPGHVEANEAFGQLGLVVEQPNSRHIGYIIAVDSGGGFVAAGTGAFNTYATLQAAIARMDDTIVVTPIYGIDVNSILLIGGVEFVRIDAIDVSAVSTWELTIGRGCIDTAPVAHAMGASVFRAFDASTDGLAYLDGASIDIAVMTQTTSGILSATDATPLELTFDSRAIRPYPPGRFKIDGSYPDYTIGSGEFISADAVLTWVGRDRLLQTDETFIEDHDDAAIGPEAGTTYRIVIECLDADLVSLGISLDTNVGAAVTYTTSAADFDSDAVWAVVSIFSVRDGYESWTAPTITRPFIGALELEEGGDPILTEAGDVIFIE